MTLFLLALKLLKREWRAGEMRLLMAAIFIAMVCVTSVNIFGDRVEKAMRDQASDFLGGDLALNSPSPIPEAWLQQATKYKLQHTRSIIFFSMLSVGDKLQLASIKAVEKPYPLRGQIKISAKPFEADIVARDIPKPGTLWMQSNLFPLLGAQIGENISLGEIPLKATAALSYQPDPPGNIFSFSPYAMMNLADVAAAGIVQPGSRVQYTTLFSGDSVELKKYTDWLTPKLAPGQSLITGENGRLSLQNTLTRIQHYLGLGSLLSMLLAGVALLVSLKRFTRRHYDMVALMRCYGASARDVLFIYIWMLLSLGGLAIFLGCLGGYLAQSILEHLLRAFLQFQLPPASLFGLGLSALMGLLILLVFGLPPLWQLTRVLPLKVLRRDLIPLPISSIWIYTLALGLMLGFMLWYTKDLTLALVVLHGCIAAFVLFLLGGWGLIALMGRLRKRVGVSWRYGLANLNRRWQTSLLQITTFGFTLMVLLLLIIIKNNFLSAWQAELPPHAPNYFVINIAPEQVSSIEKEFSRVKAIKTEQLFPMIRGRLYLLNGQNILEVLSDDKRNDEIFQREINLSYTNTLPHNNQLVQGVWGKGGISVEKGLAGRLGLKIGDRLGFRIGAETIEGKISSIREVNWGSLQPNFYVLFPSGILEHFPSTYMTSVYLPPSSGNLIAELVTKFPNITVINITEILAQVQQLLGQAGNAIQYLLFFAFLIGLIVLFACVYASLDERIYESKILRALGATRRQIMMGLMAEFLTLGALSGLLAGIIANVIGMGLGYWVFQLSLGFQFDLMLISTLGGAIVVAGIGGSLIRPASFIK